MLVKKNLPESITTKKSKKSKKMEKIEKCPLCLENLDANFEPCCCGYKICMFCWNKICSEADPKCPLCRRTYSENPAKFEPLSPDEIQKLKTKKKQEDVKKKQKLAEDRKQLSDIRVVRKNLIYVHDLPLNFNKDTKVYCKFLTLFKQVGPVKKVVALNSSKNYAGQKAPYSRAYVTYLKNEDALKALKLNENVEFEGRELKMSLGTTKYCSNYIKNTTCTNKECVYLHEQADAEASFTKEQIHAGKHIEYSQKLYDQYLTSLQLRINLINIEERNSETHSPHTEESEKEIIENCISASTSQQYQNQQIQIEHNSPPKEKVNGLFHPRYEKDVSAIMNSANFETIEIISAKTQLNNPPRSSGDMDILRTNQLMFASEKLNTKQETFVQNGAYVNEDRFLNKSEKPLYSLHNDRNLQRSENFPSISENSRSSNHFNNSLRNPLNHQYESKDDDLDFDPINMSLSGLMSEINLIERESFGQSPISNSTNSSTSLYLNKTPLLHQQKESSSIAAASKYIQSMLHKIPPQPQQPGFSSTNNFSNMMQSTSYPQSRGQNMSVQDYFNNQSYSKNLLIARSPALSSQTSSHRSPMLPQQQQHNPLTIQLPPTRYSPGMSNNSSMVNGYSPQQYLSQQISPEASFLLSQQRQHPQNQSYENFNHQPYNNYEQISASPGFNATSMQNQSIRDFGGSNTAALNNLQRMKNELMSNGRYNPFNMSQQQQPRINNPYFNSPSQTEQQQPLSKGGNNSSFMP